MSDSEANQREASPADVDTVNKEAEEDEKKESEVEEDKEKEVELAAAAASEEEHKMPTEDQVQTELTPSEEKETLVETTEHEGEQAESNRDTVTTVALHEKSATPEPEEKSKDDRGSPPNEQLVKPVERNREPSEELEYEPLLDEQIAEADDAERGREQKVLDSKATGDVDEAHLSAQAAEAPADDSEEVIQFPSVSDRRQVFETPVVPASAPKPVVTRTEQPPGKRQVSWEPRVETITVDQSRTTHEFGQGVPQQAVSDDWSLREPQVHTPGRLVYNEAPIGLNNQSVGQVANQMTTMTINTDFSAPRRTKPYQSALYRRPQVTQSSEQKPFYVKPNFCIAPQPVSAPTSSVAPRETVEPWNNYPNQSAPPTATGTGAMQPISVSVQQQPMTPTRKISSTPPYVGSQVIASETGPSITVLLRRPVSERHWGFTFFGGSENGCPPFINKIISGSLAAQHGMEVGDVIVSICNSLTIGKTHEQLKADILRAGNELDLVLIRRGVDLNKIAQLAPKALPTSPPPSSSGSQDRQFSFAAPAARSPRAEPTVSRGRSFRSIKTKSIRILEEQLASGQSPSSVVHTKQHFQGARGLPAAGTPSSYMRAYGQNPNQGYLGRNTIDSGAPNEPVWTVGQETVVPVQYARPAYAPPPYEPSYASDRGGGGARWDQQSVGQPTWDTQSYSGPTSGWAMPTAAYQPTPQPVQHHYVQPQMNMVSPQPVVYPNPSYSPGSVYTASTNISVPVHAHPQWPSRPY